MDPPACTIELGWTRDGEPQQLSHLVKIKGAKKPLNFFHIRYSPPAFGELCSFVHDYASDVYVHTNTVSTNTVPDTPSGATSTVQDVTASPAEHSKQGIHV